MIVQPMSDIHLDFPGSAGFPAPVEGVELVLIAGDTCQGLVRAISEARRAYPRPIEIAMVAGNHEYFGRSLREEMEDGERSAVEHGVRLLENSVAVFGSLRVLGCTLWTDYALFGEELRAPAMRMAFDTMADHRRIKWQRNPWMRFRPTEAAWLHSRSRSFMERELAESHDGTTLVMTHHAPTFEAVDPRLQRSLLTAAYASELLPLIDEGRPDFFLSGHSHFSMNYRRGPTRMISNPYGYAGDNPGFDPNFFLNI